MRFLLLITAGHCAFSCATVPLKAVPPTMERSFVRPSEGEWLILSLNDTKVGYLFTRRVSGTWRGKPAEVFDTEFLLRLKGVERFLRIEKSYETAPRGRLLGFRIDQRDNQTTRMFEGVCAADHVAVTHRRPGASDETKRLPPTAETIEAADVARLAAARRTTQQAVELNDALEEVTVVFTFVGESSIQTARGTVNAATVIDEATETRFSFSSDGHVVEAFFGPVRGVPGSEAEAKAITGELDARQAATVKMRRPVREATTLAAERVVVMLSGLTLTDVPTLANRQNANLLEDGRVRIEVIAKKPILTEDIDRAWMNRADLRESLQSTRRFDSLSPEVVSFAERAVGTTRNAWTAAVKLAAAVRGALELHASSPTGAPAEVLARGTASRPEFTWVFVAAARAAGIPANEVQGLFSIDGAFFLGNWAEIFVGEWISFDVFTQAPADAAHLQIRSGALGRPMTIEVEEN